MFLVENRKTMANIYIYKENNSPFIIRSVGLFIEAIRKITGAFLTSKTISKLTGNENGVILCLFDSAILKGMFKKESLKCKNDGFCVAKNKKAIFVLSHNARGLFYGLLDLIEKNTESIWTRADDGEDFYYEKSPSIEIIHYDYIENPCFEVRSWNLCGYGSEDIAHCDTKTSEWMIKNRVNGTVTFNNAIWKDYCVKGVGIPDKKICNFDEFQIEHPEWFMIEKDGTPKKAIYGADSYLNYYNKDIAMVFARRLVEVAVKMGNEVVPFWTMPDNPFFRMIENGQELQNLPFVTDEGITVYPYEENYKSTVYFNFLNRVMKEANAIRPNTYLGVFAYIYSEPVPRVKIDDHLIVYIAPISTNEKYSYVDKYNHDNDKIKANIELWAKKTNKLAIYTYWGCMASRIYSRPVINTVKENLLWFKKLGVYQIENESLVDCDRFKAIKDRQKQSTDFYDLNEMYLWIINKLMWNPDESIASLVNKYCQLVYKECSEEMKEYFSLIENGWSGEYAYVWYATGGDVYYLQFIIKAGIANNLLKVLRTANIKAVNMSVKRRIGSIFKIVEEEIEKYSNFQKEVADVYFFNEGNPLSKKSLDYKNNNLSVWNRAIPLKILKNYSTMVDYPKEAQFDCRMIYDNSNIYIAYTICDDQLEKIEGKDGNIVVYRNDGSRVESYAETYIGGDIINRDTYYGYISGYDSRTEKGQFFVNNGSPVEIEIPYGVKDVKFVHLDKIPQKRYMVHVQVIPFDVLNVDKNNAKPYGSFVYYTNRFGRAGWMGFGLWSKQNFQPFNLKKENKEKICYDAECFH